MSNSRTNCLQFLTLDSLYCIPTHCHTSQPLLRSQMNSMSSNPRTVFQSSFCWICQHYVTLTHLLLAVLSFNGFQVSTFSSCFPVRSSQEWLLFIGLPKRPRLLFLCVMFGNFSVRCIPQASCILFSWQSPSGLMG